MSHWFGQAGLRKFRSPGLEAAIEAQINKRRQFAAAHQETAPMETLNGTKL